jgi:hypothetical protein
MSFEGPSFDSCHVMWGVEKRDRKKKSVIRWEKSVNAECRGFIVQLLAICCLPLLYVVEGGPNFWGCLHDLRSVRGELRRFIWNWLRTFGVRVEVEWGRLRLLGTFWGCLGPFHRETRQAELQITRTTHTPTLRHACSQKNETA